MAREFSGMLIFIVPAYNEEDNIATLLENTRNFAKSNKYDYKIVVINDGSVDRTLEILKDYQKTMPIVILDQMINKGVGEAFKRGFSYVAETSSDDDVVISKEADNTSDLGILLQMLDKINQGYDLVLASCYISGGGVEGTNLFRRILSSGANLLLKNFSNLKEVHTYSSFYRVYKAILIKKVYSLYGDNLITEKGFSCMVELLFKFSKLNIKIAEVPMILKGALRKGRSKMRVISTIFAYFRLILKNLIFNL
ncbi:MAG: glycosyltransferase [Patescibacteria group bacterium]